MSYLTQCKPTLFQSCTLDVSAQVVKEEVEQLGCGAASKRGVDAVLSTYNNMTNFDQHYGYRAAFEDLMKLGDGLRAAGCSDRESLDAPMKATYRLAELHKSLSKSAVPSKASTGMVGVLSLAALTPPGAAVSGVAVAIGALGMVGSAIYELYGD